MFQYGLICIRFFFLLAVPYRCNDQLGLRNGDIPTSAISASTQKDSRETLDTVRLGNPTYWVAAKDDVTPWIEINFSSGLFDE